MTLSGTEVETRQSLDEDLSRQAQRMAQMAIAGASLSAAVTRRTAHSKFQTQAHKDVDRAKAEHTALKDGIYDAFISGTRTDVAVAAAEIMASAALVEIHTGCLTRVTEHWLLADTTRGVGAKATKQNAGCKGKGRVCAARTYRARCPARHSSQVRRCHAPQRGR